ncbi:conserved hypothetical protein [Cellulomonas flavigena DSM 20109]|uniref:Ribosomally synthesized peptide with SipW-like signal peptide n=1 Tax=Cellulomonas flavigena (strain ATCC 482 / DSM 20109 / BCRC 11376 / JCM 18109 / NBRC 3775 / NCIMB 8073 / NRS 134) TaxID=446466 RepID=D5ULE2_CELFN|nr:hypothetical protein [Cellulomonas flavigena]ADG73984.1 conserved hypothetical protein [Cellulomonas flavigena DSM 20109]
MNARAGTRTGVLAAVLVVAAAGTSYAVWSAAGTGAGTATTGTTVPVTLSPGTPTTRLYPGGTAEVSLTVTNPNPVTLVVPALLLDTARGTGGFDTTSGCDVSALSFTDQTNGGAGWTVPPRVGGAAGTLDVTLPAALAMGADAPDACQGATFSVYLRADP